MVNPDVAVIAMLNGSGAVTALAAARLWSPRLAPGYKPEQGSAVTLFVRGGSNGLYDPVVFPSFQVTTWAASTKQARTLMDAVTTVLHDIKDQQVLTVDGIVRVLSGEQEVFPQDVIDSDTGWFTCVSFFRLQMDLTPIT